MARVLAYTSPARGHLFPVVPILDELAARGHDIAVRTLASQVELMESRGFDAAPIDPAIERLEHDDYRARTPLGAQKRAMHVFCGRAHLDADDLRGAIDDTRPRDQRCTPGSPRRSRYAAPRAAAPAPALPSRRSCSRARRCTRDPSEVRQRRAPRARIQTPSRSCSAWADRDPRARDGRCTSWPCTAARTRRPSCAERRRRASFAVLSVPRGTAAESSAEADT
jgi:hypothetical protein